MTSSATFGALHVALRLSVFAQCLLRVFILCMTDTDDVALLELAYVLRLYRFYVCAFVENAFAFSYGSVLRFHRMVPAICHRYGRHTE